LAVGARVSDDNLKFPQWQAPLQALILEIDQEKVQAKIGEVETLVYERLQQICYTDDGHIERVAIFDALSAIRIIKMRCSRVP
jgi:hypothetical protein